jgi:hypothetical protein
MADSIPEADSLPSARLCESRVVLDFVSEQLALIGAAIVRANSSFATSVVINLTNRFPRIAEVSELSGICTKLIIESLEEKGYLCQLRAEPPEIHLRVSWGQTNKQEELESASSYLALRMVRQSPLTK